ncbi:unnamed protein product, partial [Meganyctiphanes norvegica]
LYGILPTCKIFSSENSTSNFSWQTFCIALLQLSLAASPILSSPTSGARTGNLVDWVTENPPKLFVWTSLEFSSIFFTAIPSVIVDAPISLSDTLSLASWLVTSSVTS